MARAKSTSVTVWEQQMAAAAVKAAAAEKPAGSFRSVGTRGGILTVDDTPVKGNAIRCVVLMSMHENQYYEGAFDPSNIQVPQCYAFGEPDGEGADMHPHPECAEKQSEACEGCWANEMGSADTGRGKACKNIRRLALVTEDAMESASALEEAEIRALKVPVTSVKNWSKFVHRVAEEMQRPSWGVVCLISAVADPKTQFKLTFEFESLVSFDQALMDTLTRRRAELAREMATPYQQPTEQAAPARGKKPARSKPDAVVSKKPAPARTPGNRGTVKRGKF